MTLRAGGLTGLMNQPSAQVIDGSLKFDEDTKNYLKITPGSAGNRRTWTWSGWVKRDTFGSSLMSRFFMGGTTSTSSGNAVIAFYQDRLFWQIHSSSERITTNRLFRDTGWYHIVVALDTTLASDFGTSERVKIYVNGKREYSFSTSGYPGQNMDSGVNSTEGMLLGAGRDSSGNEPDGPFDGKISNVYLIDGVALGPGYFGFTDPLTGTWRPRKFKAEGTTVNDGTVWSDTCTFLRPTSGFDGNANTSNAAYLSSAGTGTITTAPFTIKDSLRIYNNARSDQGGQYTVTLNGVPVSFDGSGTSSTAYRWTDIDLSGFALPLKVTNFQYTVPGSSGTGFDAVQVDGTLMLDSTTTNLSFGTNGFYLPLDGNSSIGKDQSGNGNDFTPVNFGGSVALDNPQVSGARPILNTTQGGTQAGVGVFGSRENIGYAVTVYNDGGGNKYYIDGVKQDTVTGLIRGATYTFDTSDSTVSSHPFRFSATSNGSHGGGSEYTNGVAAITGAATTITVPHDAPNTLYYYCTSHSGMGADITGITTNEKLADQYASKCVLALPLVGSNVDVCASIACTMSAKTLAVNGDAASSGAASNFYAESFKFDGSGDYLGATSNSDFAMGTGDFTLECWVYRTGGSGFTNYIATRGAAGSANGYTFGAQGSAAGYDVEFYTNSLILTGGDQLIYNNKWNHVAVTRKGSTLSIYVNGILNTTTSNSQDFSNTSLAVGVTNDGSQNPMEGHLCDVRIYKGVAKYSGGSVGDQVFVVPATSPDILPDTPSGVSGGSKLTKITDGSFSNPVASGVRQFGNISVADSTDLEFGSGDFTLEAFIYYIGNPGTSNDTYAIFSKWNNESAPFDKGFILRISDDGNGDNLQWFYTTDGSTNLYTTGSTLLNPNTWYHIAFVRNGSTGTFYVDGVPDNVTVSFGSNSIRDTGNAFRIGANLDGEEPDQEFNGFISNVRVLKGTALYTSKFTPPSEPLTNITNTKILACQDNDYNVVGITTTAATGASPIFNTTGDYGETYGDGNLNADSNASDLVLCLDFYANATDRMPSGRPSNQKSLSAGGDPDPGNTTTSHFYGKSAHFDGNDQYSISSSADFSFDGEFCVELWANASSWGPFFVSGGTNGIWLGSTSNGLVIRRYGVQNDLLVQIPSFNEWVHLAFTRDDSNILRIFINGEEQGIASVNFTYTQNTLYIGSDGAGGNYTGYIQDLRVYKGTAKYTSDFNPPFRSLNRVKAAVSPSQFRHTWYAGGPVSLSPFNTDINTVRGQETGYCTLNALDTKLTQSNGNLNATSTSGLTWVTGRGTLAMPSGKFYWEVTVNTVSHTDQNTVQLGIGALSASLPSADGYQDANAYVYANYTQQKANGGSASTYGVQYTAGDTVGVTFDADTGTLAFYVNGSSQGNAYTGLDATKRYAPLITLGRGGTSTSISANWGQKPFKFAPPDGFQPLNAANVRPETVIARPDQYVGVTTYTGTGATRHMNIGLQPDFVWIKQRNAAVENQLFDSVRGPGKILQSDTANSEYSASNLLSSFNSDGFTLESSNFVNGTTSAPRNYVAWFWKAGGNKGTFNIDGEGYANASDVNMSVGALNNVAFNKDQTWSGLITPASGSFDQAATNAFNGNIVGGDPDRLRTSGNNILVTMTFSTPVNVLSQVKVYGETGYNSTCTITVNGVTNTSSTGRIHTFNVSGSLTQMTIVTNEGSSRTYMEGMEIDGEQLVDTNISTNVPSIAATGASVGTKQGFSIVKYTGNASSSGGTIPHGLSQKPEFLIFKDLDGTDLWHIHHKDLSLSNTVSGYKYLTFTNAAEDNPVLAGITDVSNFAVTFGSQRTELNGANSFISYMWHSVPGLQKFGIFEGNGSTDGPYVELGFRPAVLIRKSIDSTRNWSIVDSERNAFNPMPDWLRPDTSDSETGTGYTDVDFLSNGFKVRTNGAVTNSSSTTYIYAAWAEAPAFNLYGGQSNAR